MLEDTVLHPKLPFVVWLMVASSTAKFVLSERHVNECLQIVHEIARSPIRDPIETVETTSGKKINVPTLDEISQMQNGEAKLLILSILIRQYNKSKCFLKIVEMLISLQTCFFELV